jgi:dihydrofolate reductase
VAAAPADVAVGLIAAVARNGVVGVDGRLPWHLPDDLAHFKRQTRGHVVVLGRRTWEEIGRPLPGRTHIVVSTTLAAPPQPTVHLARSLDEALERGRALEAALRARDADAGAAAQADATVWIIGGPRLWAEAIAHASIFWLTEIDAEPEGDTIFPTLDLSDFERVEVREGEGEPSHRFVRLQRRTRAAPAAPTKR